MWFPGYASAVSFGLCDLLHNCNPRCGWLVRPYPTGTSTLQETPSLLGAQRPRAQRPGKPIIDLKPRPGRVRCSELLESFEVPTLGVPNNDLLTPDLVFDRQVRS